MFWIDCNLSILISMARLPLSEWKTPLLLSVCENSGCWRGHLKLTPLVNQWWNVPLHVTARELEVRYGLLIRPYYIVNLALSGIK